MNFLASIWTTHNGTSQKILTHSSKFAAIVSYLTYRPAKVIDEQIKLASGKYVLSLFPEDSA
jgi:hypothetical protein